MQVKEERCYGFRTVYASFTPFTNAAFGTVASYWWRNSLAEGADR